MKYLLRNLRIPVTQAHELASALTQKLLFLKHADYTYTIHRQALDTRRKGIPHYDFTLLIDSPKLLPSHPDLAEYTALTQPILPQRKLTSSPYIIGMGPAGLFTALAMVQNGLTPHLFDRGGDLQSRQQAVEAFWQKGLLNPESNVQYGEGGAGAFSDGKLTCRTQNWFIQQVHDALIRFGAPASIAWDALPHLGTDGIRKVVQNIRDYLISCGCRFHYHTRLEAIHMDNDKLAHITLNGEIHTPEVLILATGNSARDIYSELQRNRLSLTPKGFAIGFRIAHPQAWINRSMYGEGDFSSLLGSASYRLTAPQAGKGSYTFCMCPGGYVIPSSSEEGSCVTNGMSYSDRAHLYGNSAVITAVDTQDYGNALMDGIHYQQSLEKAAFLPGYAAPVQTAPAFMQQRLQDSSAPVSLFPSQQAYPLHQLFTPRVYAALCDALKHFDRILPGFIGEGILIAPETRTSAPLRIDRDTTSLASTSCPDIYAVGEGSGYAGGIVSSAADGYRTGLVFTAQNFCLTRTKAVN